MVRVVVSDQRFDAAPSTMVFHAGECNAFIATTDFG